MRTIKQTFLNTVAAAVLLLCGLGLAACVNVPVSGLSIRDSVQDQRVSDSLKLLELESMEQAYKAHSDAQPYVKVVRAWLDVVNGIQSANVEFENTGDVDIEGIKFAWNLRNNAGKPALQSYTVEDFPDILLLAGRSQTVGAALKSNDAASVAVSVLEIHFIDDTYWANAGRRKPPRTGVK